LLIEEVGLKISVAVGQFPISFAITENVQNILSMLEQVEPDDLLVLPEGAISGYNEDSRFLELIDRRLLADAIERIAEAVKRKHVHLIAGSCMEEEGEWYNAGLYFSPRGERALYRKVNLATGERGHFVAGADLPIFPLHFAEGSVNVGMQLCREIRFPEQWQCLAQRGAELFVYITNAANPEVKPDVWRSHLVSRAAENQRFVLAANTAHFVQHCPSMIIAPDGEVLAEVTGEETRLLRATLDLAQTGNWYLSQCRRDVVSMYYKGELVRTSIGPV
jgi:predicted amidohydrolase